MDDKKAGRSDRWKVRGQVLCLFVFCYCAYQYCLWPLCLCFCLSFVLRSQTRRLQRFVEAYGNRGVTYDKKGEYDRAISDFSKVIEINPWFTVAYYNRGNAYGAKGEYNRAISDYTKAIEIGPKYAMAYYNNANTHSERWVRSVRRECLNHLIIPGLGRLLRLHYAGKDCRNSQWEEYW